MAEHQGKRLSDYSFVDLYLGEGYADMKGLKGSPNLRDPAPEDLHSQLNEVRLLCRMRMAIEKDPEFSLVIDDVMYRVTMIREINSQEVFVLRRSNAELRVLEKIGFAPFLNRQLTSPDLKGLVLIAGATDAGKTSTAAAVLKARLERIGGIGITIEDPPEVNISGIQGRGRCMQVRASRRTGGYKEHLIRSLRSNPDMILLGEVREEDAAEEVVNAALNGHFIISTIHANGVTEAIDRLASLADPNEAQAYKKLASGLKIVIWQSLVRNSQTGKVNIRYEFLSLIGDEMSGARNKILNGRISHLAQDIDMQRKRVDVNPL